MRDYACSIQEKSITVHFMDGDAYVWPSSHPKFTEVKTALKEGADAQTIRGLMDTTQAIAKALIDAPQVLTDKITVSRDGVFYRGKLIEMSICDRILAHVAEGFDVVPLVKFLEKLLTNARREAVLSLYDFLAANEIPIWDDGDFIVYKKVRSDYKDIHSGTFDNSVGAKPRVEAWEVEADREQTCAQGLHVCSRAYLPHFGSGVGDRVVICKVNPADVVAVPRDYNNAKMRVCGYEVIGELTDVQKAEIFDKARVVTPSDHTDYVDWADDIENDDDDTCEDCGWDKSVCDCNDDSDFDEDQAAEDEYNRRQEEAEIERQAEEAEKAKPTNRGWFRW